MLQYFTSFIDHDCTLLSLW